MTPDSRTARRIERRALRRSPLGYLAFGVLGVVFFLVTHSEAILLDGVYSLISLVLALLAARVSRLVELPGSKRFHFGYAHFEPLLNTFRIALILGVDAFALFSAVDAILSGGRHLVPGIAVFYGVLSAVACLTMSAVQQRAARRVDSPILRVDARNWFVDGLISSGVGVAFLFGFLIRQGPLSGWLPYIDPILVIVIVIGSLPVTFRSVRENVPQLFHVAPPPELQSKVRTRIESVMEEFAHRELSVRMIQVGRFFYVLVHVVVPENTKSLDVAHCDRVRKTVSDALSDLYPRPIADVIFTADDRDILRLESTDKNSENETPDPASVSSV